MVTFRVTRVSAGGEATVVVFVAAEVTKGLARRFRPPLVVAFPTFF